MIGHDTYHAEIVCRGDINNYRFVATVYDFNNIFDKFIREVVDRYALTEREYEVLRCTLKGMSNADIGRKLFISVPTVKKHLTNTYQKLGIEGKHQVLGLMIK